MKRSSAYCTFYYVIIYTIILLGENSMKHHEPEQDEVETSSHLMVKPTDDRENFAIMDPVQTI